MISVVVSSAIQLYPGIITPKGIKLVFEERMRNNASSAVEKLLDLQAKEATILQAGKPVKIPLDQVVSSAIQLYPGIITPKGIKLISTNIGSDKTKANQKRF